MPSIDTTAKVKQAARKTCDLTTQLVSTITQLREIYQQKKDSIFDYNELNNIAIQERTDAGIGHFDSQMLSDALDMANNIWDNNNVTA